MVGMKFFQFHTVSSRVVLSERVGSPHRLTAVLPRSIDTPMHHVGYGGEMCVCGGGRGRVIVKRHQTRNPRLCVERLAIKLMGLKNNSVSGGGERRGNEYLKRVLIVIKKKF